MGLGIWRGRHSDGHLSIMVRAMAERLRRGGNGGEERSVGACNVVILAAPVEHDVANGSSFVC